MRLLVIRTSAMGDVALTAPVLSGMRKQYPEIEMVLLTRPSFKPFFTSISGLDFFFPDLKKRHKGIAGIMRLYRDLTNQNKFDAVIDLHDVLRSKLLRFLFLLSGVKVAVINKGRIEKRSLVTGRRKIQLKHSVERYCDVFAKAGYIITPLKETSIKPSSDSVVKAVSMLDPDDKLNIGVAPFAKHKLKMWPLENMESLLRLIYENNKCRFWLFGGAEDQKLLAELQEKVPGSINIFGKLNLEEELALMSKLDLMIAMDSSNMHMAALVGTKVVTIWGGTDPLSGFGAWMQPESHSIRISVDELTCRPCTTYGKGECHRGDFACMNRLTPEMVYNRIKKLNIIPV